MPRNGKRVGQFDKVRHTTDGRRFEVSYVVEQGATSYYLRELDEPYKVLVVGEDQLKESYEKFEESRFMPDPAQDR